MNRVAQIAWAAGIIEGEGSIHVRDRGSHRSIVLTVVMTDLDVLNSLRMTFGKGNIVGPYQHKQLAHHKPQWHWNVTCARDVAAITMTLYRLFHERRRAQVREVLEVWQTMPGHPNGRRYC